ncbi:hypothetical protein O181_019749 [Austropuccinia psidii MF-1]|uniref:non-specific serine/threonine protein kinase n=1 Tax=Austropuccinia psidii MF-1 TaxID=1389203 RepID=A0A9Q3CA57_9BASI|nr:hypothetical protein [Austropuccinia psidii MF-1]
MIYSQIDSSLRPQKRLPIKTYSKSNVRTSSANQPSVEAKNLSKSKNQPSGEAKNLSKSKNQPIEINSNSSDSDSSSSWVDDNHSSFKKKLKTLKNNNQNLQNQISNLKRNSKLELNSYDSDSSSNKLINHQKNLNQKSIKLNQSNNSKFQVKSPITKPNLSSSKFYQNKSIKQPKNVYRPRKNFIESSDSDQNLNSSKQKSNQIIELSDSDQNPHCPRQKSNQIIQSSDSDQNPHFSKQKSNQITQSSDSDQNLHSSKQKSNQIIQSSKRDQNPHSFKQKSNLDKILKSLESRKQSAHNQRDELDSQTHLSSSKSKLLKHSSLSETLNRPSRNPNRTADQNQRLTSKTSFNQSPSTLFRPNTLLTRRRQTDFHRPSPSGITKSTKSVLRDKINCIHNSPRPIIPASSNSKPSPHSCKPLAQVGHTHETKPNQSNLNQTSSPAFRQVRGRLSFVTSSARRNRFQPLAHTNQQSPRPISLPQSATPQKNLLDRHSTKNHPQLAIYSPFIRHQTPTSPYFSKPISTEISSLLNICDQPSILDFASLVKKLCHGKDRPASTLSRNQSRSKGICTKIGEASYSEVFVFSNKDSQNSKTSSTIITKSSLSSNNQRIVMKVIPIRRANKIFQNQAKTEIVNWMDDQSDKRSENFSSNDFPCETEWSDAEKEVKLTKLLGSKSVQGFINFEGCLVVSGAYPQLLLKEWDIYRKQNPKQALNPRPSKFSSKQLYCCIMLAHAGKDLETSPLNRWQEAASIFSQVLHALSWAEQHYQFEHRDLHWGNLLIENSSEELQQERLKDSDRELKNLTVSMNQTNLNQTTPKRSLNSDPLDPYSSGIVVSLIDYGLSRATIDKSKLTENQKKKSGKEVETIWTEPDPELFGISQSPFDQDYQFKCYDLMNIARGQKSWSDPIPISNVVWLHYLAKKLIEEKGLVEPINPMVLKERPKRNKESLKDTKQLQKDEVEHEESSPRRNLLKIEYQCYRLLIESERVLDQLIENEISGNSQKKGLENDLHFERNKIDRKQKNKDNDHHNNKDAKTSSKVIRKEQENGNHDFPIILKFLEWWNEYKNQNGL